MKKLYFLVIVMITLALSACTPEEPVIDNSIDETEKLEVQNYFFGNRENKTAWAVAMQKPSIDEMENFDAIVNGYSGEWYKQITLTESDIEELGQNRCDKPRISWHFSDGYGFQEIQKDDIISGNIINVTGTYNFPNILSLTDDENKILAEKGWVITPSSSLNMMQMDYEESSSNDIVDFYNIQEEWVKDYKAIAGCNKEYDRNPANSILITNDLLLHSFHKLFDNTLKYYEKTTVRNQISELSQALFDKFTALAQNEKNPELKEMYNFLKMYWVIPNILLVNKEGLTISKMNEWDFMEETNNLSDEELKEIIMKNADNYLKDFTMEEQNIITNILDEILSATNVTQDVLLMSYSPDFILINQIKQDYTQFIPRSHYTDNAELKTYFMAMKWLMREKFYFGDEKLAKTALVMVANISDEESGKLSDLSTRIKKLIGGDDDLTLESLSNWMKNNNIISANDVLTNLTDDNLSELLSLASQKIQSTVYSTESQMEISEENARDMTAGFVFFGEKFTLDSYLFDLMTAGSAEKEYEFRPALQTAIMIPEILESNSKAEELTNLWMVARVQKGEIKEDTKHTQFSSYDDVKANAIDKLKSELQNSDIMNTVYHKWIDMLGYLINENEENAPYFKLDPTYLLKNLVTYMGSYTELKHDTLLYVKQNYAELGGAGGGCEIYVQPEALPVPKGYVEADLDLLNELIKLNSETMSDFEGLGEEVLANFVEFDKFLNHIKEILIKQMNNEIISDEDFEWMRTAYDKLAEITYPLNIGSVTLKEMRAALIADIFTSEGPNPLYEAVGRPAIMLVMIDDINGKRVALGPVFTHYEFYDSDDVIDAQGTRLNDIQWQDNYDELSENKAALSIVSKWLKRGLVVENS